MKTKQDNDMTNHTGVISTKYVTELSRLIKQCVFYDKDKKRQRHDQSYWSVLRRKELNCHDRSNSVRSTMKCK